MITAGMDLGASFAKMVILEDGKIIGRAMTQVTLDPQEAIEVVKSLALKDAHIEAQQIRTLGVTGSGRKLVKDGDLYVTDVTADAVGANGMDGAVRTVIDVGGEESRAIKVDQKGSVVNFAVNDKCAAGAGAFCEAMARALEVSLEDFASLSMKSTKRIPINAQCVIFAESEVVSLISDEVSREDICRAVNDGISDRISAMARRVGLQEKVALIGGAVKNAGLVHSIKEDLGMEVVVLPDPEFVSAFGTALLAAREGRE